jgi:Sigma-70 factor, region 1.1
MIPTTAVDRLVQLGRRQAGLDTDDIRRALPIDTMTIDEITEVVAHLEEVGVSVEIDPALLVPQHRKMAPPELQPTPKPSRHSERVNAPDARLSNLAVSIKAAEEAHKALGPPRKYVQKSGTIFVIAAALILSLLALAFWRLA